MSNSLHSLSALSSEYTDNVPPHTSIVQNWPTISSFRLYYDVTLDSKNSDPDLTEVIGIINQHTLARAKYHVLLARILYCILIARFL